MLDFKAQPQRPHRLGKFSESLGNFSECRYTFRRIEEVVWITTHVVNITAVRTVLVVVVLQHFWRGRLPHEKNKTQSQNKHAELTKT